MDRSRVRNILVVTTLVVIALAAIVWSTFRQAQVSCEVCIAYQGRSQCRTAQGATREDAIRTATDNACAFLSTGMAEGIQCANTPPTKTECAP